MTISGEQQRSGRRARTVRVAALPRQRVAPDQNRPRPVVPAGGSVRVRRPRARLWKLAVVLVAGLVTALLTDPRPPSFVALVVTGLLVMRTGFDPLRVPSRLLLDLTLPITVVAGLTSIAPGTLHVADPVGDLRFAILVVVVMILAQLATVGLVRRYGHPPRIVVVSDRSVAAVAAARWTGRRGADVAGSVIVDHAATDHTPDAASSVAVVPGVEAVVDQVRAWEADLVVVVPGSELTAREVRRLSWSLERTGVPVALAGVLDAVAPHRLAFGTVGGTTVLLSGSSRPSVGVRAAKWLVDRTLAAVLLVVALPVIAACSVAIRLDSRGPVIFRQERVGLEGRRFTMLKLRTMHAAAEDRLAELADADQAAGPLFKVHDDPRITRVGRVLRRTSLDELPQLINVLRGDMSLVGPRPALPSEVAQYDELVARRLVVRPGITGLWQVSGRSDLDWDESVELDLHYADNYRLGNDLLIGLRTVEAVARARGAY